MKINLINGSPKAKNSCSDYLLKEIKKLLAENNEIYEFNARAGILPVRSLETLNSSHAIVFDFNWLMLSFPFA